MLQSLARRISPDTVRPSAAAATIAILGLEGDDLVASCGVAAIPILTATALPGAALAHPGHIADTGQGHAHWLPYVLLGLALFAGAAWGAITRRNGS